MELFGVKIQSDVDEEMERFENVSASTLEFLFEQFGGINRRKDRPDFLPSISASHKLLKRKNKDKVDQKYKEDLENFKMISPTTLEFLASEFKLMKGPMKVIDFLPSARATKKLIKTKRAKLNAPSNHWAHKIPIDVWIKIFKYVAGTDQITSIVSETKLGNIRLTSKYMNKLVLSSVNVIHRIAKKCFKTFYKYRTRMTINYIYGLMVSGFKFEPMLDDFLRRMTPSYPLRFVLNEHGSEQRLVSYLEEKSKVYNITFKWVSNTEWKKLSKTYFNRK